MSAKSLTGLIHLTDSPDVIRSKITTATTDSGHEIRASEDKPGISNLITIYSIVNGKSREQIESTFSRKTYAEFKAALADNLVEYLRPFWERYELLREDRGYLGRTMLEGSYERRQRHYELLRKSTKG